MLFCANIPRSCCESDLSFCSKIRFLLKSWGIKKEMKHFRQFSLQILFLKINTGHLKLITSDFRQKNFLFAMRTR